MTFRRFAFNNVMRNKRTYAAYFLSSAFSVMVFFVYAVFAFHPVLTGGSVHRYVSTAMHFAEGLIYAFSFFFVLYSMSSFLKTRKKEFGLMVMLGMSDGQLRRMVFLENVLIGLFATASGIGLGLVMAKLMLLFAENLLGLDQPLPFYWPFEAIGLAFGAFLVLFVVISLFTVAILRSNNLIDLIKGSAKPKKEPKASTALSLLSFALLAAGYATALAARGTVVFLVMIPVTLAVIVGTYFLFTQLSVFVIGKSRGNRSLFWRKTNMLFLSDLAYRMKDNARTFFMVAILSTVAFSAIGSLLGFKTMVTREMTHDHPFAFDYTDKGAAEGQASQDVAEIERSLRERGFEYRKLTAGMSAQPVKGKEGESVFVAKASEFNALATAAGEKPVESTGDKPVMIYYRILTQNSSAEPEKVVLANGEELAPAEARSSSVLPVYKTYYVVPDERYDRMAQDNRTTFYAFDVDDWKKTKELGKALEKKLANSPNPFYSVAYELSLANQSFGIVLFIGFFIGAVFFVASGSFLYFRLYADLPDDKAKFKAIRKLGLTDRELNGILTKQLLVLFFVPIVVALIHGAVALTAMQNMFERSLMSTSLSVLGAFFVIQLAYFLFIRMKYVKEVVA